MVIVILGILAAVVVPKFFDFTTDAHKSNVESVIGTIKSGLEIYAADQIVTNGYKKYIKGGDFELSDVLDQIPENWSVSGTGEIGIIKYEGDSNYSSGVLIEYVCTGSPGDNYTMALDGAAYGWADGKTF